MARRKVKVGDVIVLPTGERLHIIAMEGKPYRLRREAVLSNSVSVDVLIASHS